MAIVRLLRRMRRGRRGQSPAMAGLVSAAAAPGSRRAGAVALASASTGSRHLTLGNERARSKRFGHRHAATAWLALVRPPGTARGTSTDADATIRRATSRGGKARREHFRGDAASAEALPSTYSGRRATAAAGAVGERVLDQAELAAARRSPRGSARTGSAATTPAWIAGSTIASPNDACARDVRAADVVLPAELAGSAALLGRQHQAARVARRTGTAAQDRARIAVSKPASRSAATRGKAALVATIALIGMIEQTRKRNVKKKNIKKKKADATKRGKCSIGF